MKKNYLLFLFGFISFFLFSNNSKALTTYNYGYLYEKFEKYDYNFQFNDQTLNVKDDIDKLNNALKESGMNYIVIFETGNASYSRFQPTLFVTEYSVNSTSFEKNSNDGSEWYTFGRSNTSGYIYLSNTYSNEFQSGIEELIEYINTNKHIPKNNLSYVKYSSGRYFSLLTADSSKNINGQFFMYDTNMTVKLTNLYNNEFMINGNIYKENSILPTYKSIYGKIVYSEDFRVDSKDIDRIEYTFEIPQGMFSQEFNFSTTWYSDKARLDLFSIPYLEYIDSNNVTYKLPLDKNKISNLDEVTYYDTTINSFQPGTIDLKFVVNFNNINALTDSSVFIHFDSNFPFSRKIIYTNDEESSTHFYQKVDFSGYYGVMLIPKLLVNELNQQVYSTIFYQGKALRISLFDSIDTTKKSVKEITDYNNVGGVWGNYNYLFKFNNYNQYLFFVNDNYLTDPEKTIVNYDTRYFVYTLCKSSDSCDPITNPNTGEEIIIKPPEISSDDEEDDGGLFSMFHFFEKPIKFIFDGIGTLYNDYTLPVVQKYWYFAFGFTVFLIILKLLF